MGIRTYKPRVDQQWPSKVVDGISELSAPEITEYEEFIISTRSISPLLRNGSSPSTLWLENIFVSQNTRV